MNLSLNEIIREFNFGDELESDLHIENVAIDSRKISAGDVFVCINGENFDGHDFLSDAFQRGAICAIVEKKFDSNDRIFKVESTLGFLQNLAKYYLEKFDVQKIGITGSVGKSSVKEMVSSIFETEFNITKNDGNFNGQIGLPLTCFKVNDDTQVAIFEMGISEKGEMEKLSRIVNPDFALINNIGVSHLGNFGNLETTCREKLKIASNGCKLFINGDNSELLENCKDMNNVILFGLNGNFKYSAENIFLSSNEAEFTLVTESYREIIKVPCAGMHNVYNALGAISLAIEFGIHIEDIKKGLLNFKALPMRQKIIYFKNFTIIDDSYNASPDSVKASISVLQSIKSTGRNILIIADILELGDYAREIHFSLGKYISLCKIDIIISIGNYSNYICESVKLLNDKIETYNFYSNDEAYSKLLQILKKNDKILVKGSREMRTDEIVSRIVEKFGEEIEKEEFEKS